MSGIHMPGVSRGGLCGSNRAMLSLAAKVRPWLRNGVCLQTPVNRYPIQADPQQSLQEAVQAADVQQEEVGILSSPLSPAGTGSLRDLHPLSGNYDL